MPAIDKPEPSPADAASAIDGWIGAFLESVPVAISVIDAGGLHHYMNGVARRLTGASPESAAAELRLPAFLAGSGEPYPEGRLPVIRALAGETSMVDDIVLRRADGDIYVQMWGAPIRDDAGAVTHAIAVFSNITAQKRFEAALMESEARFRTVFEEGPLGMAIVSTDHRFIQVNQALCDITGYRGDELAGRSFLEITHPEDRNIEAERSGSLQRGEIELLDVEKRYLRKDGEMVWVRVCVRVVRDGLGEAAYQLAMVQDITEQRRAQAQVERMAYADPLTDLPNRRLMYDRLGQAIARARRHGGGVTLLSIDLDGFKRVNDRYGHGAGDALLVETAKRLCSCVRDTDTVARMGGDEFLVMLTEAGAEAVDLIRRRIAQALSRPVLYADAELVALPSIGAAAFGRDGDDADTLVNAADARMHADKAHHTLTRSS